MIFSRFLALLLSSSKTHFPTKQNRTTLFYASKPAINDDNFSSNITGFSSRSENQNFHATITYRLRYTRTSGGRLGGIFEVHCTQLPRKYHYIDILIEKIFSISDERNDILKLKAPIYIFNTCCLPIFCFA